MSLIVWLPLNGDLHNQGLSPFLNANIQTGVTADTNGKIGKCYTNTGTNIAVGTPCQITLNQFTVCGWIKINEKRSSWQRSFGMNGDDCYIGIGCEHTNGTSLGFHCFKTVNGTNTSVFDNYPTSINLGVWTHYTVVYNGQKFFIYVNGIQASSGNANQTNITLNMKNLWLFGAHVSGSPACSLNDIRIYDHALSAAEVKEISQGLVLHYKLDQPANINNNLYTGSQNFTGTWVNSSAWTTSTETYQNFTVKQRSATWGGLAQNVSCAQGDIFTISFWGKVDSGGNIQSVHRSNLGNVTTGLTILNGNFSSGTIWVNNSEDGTQWKRYWGTVQITGSDVTYLQWRLENSVSGKNFYICGIKLEKGSAPSAWSLAASEAGETNIIYDSSGYSHNGEVLNTVSLISDTPRYDACTHISATNQKIKISNFPTSGFGNSYSFSWWAKMSSVNPMHWGFADGIRLNGMYTGRLWNTGDSSNNPLYTPGTTTQVAAPTVNVWHHWVMTGDGTTCKVYQDGVYWGVAKTYKAISGQTIYINGWDSGTSYCSDNYSISDFRIYCTALSAEDVLSLYHTSAKVDNKQNLHSFELVESNSAIQINKRGQVLCNELEEDAATKFYKTDQIIETNEIIEL